MPAGVDGVAPVSPSRPVMWPRSPAAVAVGTGLLMLPIGREGPGVTGLMVGTVAAAVRPVRGGWPGGRGCRSTLPCAVRVAPQ